MSSSIKTGNSLLRSTIEEMKGSVRKYSTASEWEELDTYVEGLVNGYKNDDEEVQRSCLKMHKRRFSHDLWIEANPERIPELQNCTPEDLKRDMAAAPHDDKIHIVYIWYQTTVFLKWEDHVAEFDKLLCDPNGKDNVEQIIEVLAQAEKKHTDKRVPFWPTKEEQKASQGEEHGGPALTEGSNRDSEGSDGEA
jgi:hypothetical protein